MGIANNGRNGFASNFNARRYDLGPKIHMGLILSKAETNDFEA
jgi:hypothetical protein